MGERVSKEHSSVATVTLLSATLVGLTLPRAQRAALGRAVRALMRGLQKVIIG